MQSPTLWTENSRLHTRAAIFITTLRPYRQWLAVHLLFCANRCAWSQCSRVPSGRRGAQYHWTFQGSSWRSGAEMSVGKPLFYQYRTCRHSFWAVAICLSLLCDLHTDLKTNSRRNDWLSEYSELVFFEYLLPKNNGIEIPLFPAAYLIIVLFSKSTKLVNIFIHGCWQIQIFVI